MQLSGKFKAFSWTWHNINTHLHICLISFSFSIVGGHFSSALTLRWFSCLWVCTLFTFRAFWPKSLLVQTCFFPCNNPSLNFKCHRLKTGSATKIHQRLLDNRHSFHVRNAVGRGATSNGCTGRGGAPQGFTNGSNVWMQRNQWNHSCHSLLRPCTATFFQESLCIFQSVLTCKKSGHQIGPSETKRNQPPALEV